MRNPVHSAPSALPVAIDPVKIPLAKPRWGSGIQSLNICEMHGMMPACETPMANNENQSIAGDLASPAVSTASDVPRANVVKA